MTVSREVQCSATYKVMVDCFEDEEFIDEAFCLLSQINYRRVEVELAGKMKMIFNAGTLLVVDAEVLQRMQVAVTIQFNADGWDKIVAYAPASWLGRLWCKLRRKPVVMRRVQMYWATSYSPLLGMDVYNEQGRRLGFVCDA